MESFDCMGFGVIGIQKCQKFLPVFFFFSLLSCYYGFTNCSEILNFVFSNIIPRQVLTCKILTFHNYKAQKFLKFSFLAFLANFLKNFALKSYCTLKMFLLSAQNNFYFILSSYVEGHVRKNLSLNFMSSVCFQASKIWMFFIGKFAAEQVLKSFSGRNYSLKTPVLGFCNSLSFGLAKSRN